MLKLLIQLLNGIAHNKYIPGEEVEWLTRIMRTAGDGMEVGLSQVSVSEDDVITILSGPLKSMEGYIRNIDLHRRIAKVEVEFMNRKTVIHLGIEMVEQKQSRER